MIWSDLLKTKAMRKVDTKMALVFDRARQQQKKNQDMVAALERAAMDGEQIWFHPNEETEKCIIMTPRSGSMPS